jgi:GT2 family glycosyltransferase/glycosyltransferase involved in cell wall biosynthesis
MGLGSAARGIAHALDSAAVPFNVLNFEYSNPSLHRDESWKHKEVEFSSYDFTILAVNPDNIFNAKARVQKKFVRDRYTIGCWSWELPEMPDSWLAAFSLVDEVWVPSRFVQDSISLKSPVPVFRVPHAVSLGPTDQFSRASFSLPERQFLFLSMSDTQSQLARKNPLGVLRAFKNAFPKTNDQVGLVLKINNVNTIHNDHEALALIREEIKGHENIYLLDSDMTRAEIDALLAACDCFVSLHRSEGFGLGPAEAMSLGKPVIVTRWSGNTDYMTPTNSIGIDYHLVPVGEQYGPYGPDQLWAEPDLQRAAFWMKRLVNDPQLAKSIGALGQETIKTEFSPESVGAVIRQRLNYLRQSNPSPFQVFPPRKGEYHESHSAVREFGRGRWQRVTVNLRRGLGDATAPVRVDPGNSIGIFDLAAISLRSRKTGQIIWRLKTRRELASLRVSGTALELPHDRLLRLLSFGDDPQVFLPLLRGPQFADPLALEAWIRLETSPRFIADSLVESKFDDFERRRAELEKELRVERRQGAELKEQLAGLEAKLTQLQEELAAREKDRGQLERKLGEEELSRTHLRQELTARKNEEAEFHEILATKENEHSRLADEIRAIKDQLELTRRTMWEIKVRRADATARLKLREWQLQEIQSSWAWQIVKPIAKLQKHLRRSSADETQSPAKMAFFIDLPGNWDSCPETLLVKGWCFHPSGEKISGVRARIGSKKYLGSYGFERPDVVEMIGHGSNSLESGFLIDCSVPVGPSRICLEAIVQGGDWQTFFEHDISRGPLEQEPIEAPPDRVEALAKEDQLAARAQTEIESALQLLSPLFEEHAQTAGNRALPRFTVITPTFNTKVRWLAEAAHSLLSQTFKDWEWCIVDDGSTSLQTRRMLESLAHLSPRLHISFAERGGISVAKNQAIALASGKYLCFMDDDGLLAPNALGLVSRKIDEGFDVVYSDEDRLNEATGELEDAFFKPDWSPEYFRAVMYIGHLLTARRTLAEKTGFDKAFDDIHDFEFMLRLSETDPRIGHIPKTLYHWRRIAANGADGPEAEPDLDLLQKKAVDAHLNRMGLPAVTKICGDRRLRVIPNRKSNPQNISIIIPTKDAPFLIGRCLASIYERTTYPRFEVILMDNGTTDASALDVMRSYPVRRLEFPNPFNFSRANNLGSEQVPDGFLVFLNNDTEVVTPDWLEHLLYYAEQPDVGAVGPLLLYDDRTVQHAGVALGMRGTADHVMRGFSADMDGYAGSLTSAREVSAVTAACTMISKSRFEEVGRFNDYFATAYQDVDLCLRLRERGFRIVYTPQAVLIHHESASRKDYYDMVDRMFLLDQWETVIEKGDPYFNRNFDLERGDYSLAAR